jgi:hypothetical protein
LVGVACGDDVAEFIGDGFESRGIRRCGRVCGEFAGEFLVLGLEGVKARIQGG